MEQKILENSALSPLKCLENDTNEKKIILHRNEGDL